MHINFIPKALFSEEYDNIQKRRDFIRGKVLDAILELDQTKATIFGQRVDTRDPEQIIAYLFLSLKDKSLFKES